MKHTIEDLKDIYRCLYETNEVAAEEDYLEYFVSEYSPDRLDECDTISEVKDELCHLVEEILNDTGDEDLTREWLLEAGADDEILVLCNLGRAETLDSRIESAAAKAQEGIPSKEIPVLDR